MGFLCGELVRAANKGKDSCGVVWYILCLRFYLLNLLNYACSVFCFYLNLIFSTKASFSLLLNLLDLLLCSVDTKLSIVKLPELLNAETEPCRICTWAAVIRHPGAVIWKWNSVLRGKKSFWHPLINRAQCPCRLSGPGITGRDCVCRFSLQSWH